MENNQKEQPFGFININKPKGKTSHDIVAILRKITKIKQIGHTGTLDPFAQGVLPVCIGKATRLADYLKDEKEYIATIQFGSNTTTYDIEGEITESFNIKVNQEEILKCLPEFMGEIEQYPPIYSAIKINGKKLYEYARKGEEIVIKPRKVKINNIELLKFDEEKQSAKIIIACEKGTYIRSLAYDLGKKLGSGAYLTDLIRTKSGGFSLNTVVNIEDLSSENFSSKIINPLEVLILPKIEVLQKDLRLIQTGSELNNNSNINNGEVLLNFDNKICALAVVCGNKIRMKKVFI